MDRRKLRRLLASSSFAAILIAAQSARGQGDLTNPAGNTVPFLRVDPGETVDNVRNEGLIENSAGDPGIEVFGTGANPAAVLGEIDNIGTISVTGSTQATGILVHGTTASVGEGIDNQGRIDVEARRTAYGIALDGSNFSVSGGVDDEPAILNDGTIDVLQHNISGSTDTVVQGSAIATLIESFDGKAAGIIATSDVSLDGLVVNDGDLNVTGSNEFAWDLDLVGITGQARFAGDFDLDLEAAGIDLSGELLPGLTNEGDIAVAQRDEFVLAVLANGNSNAQIRPALSLRANATGIALDIDTIDGAVIQNGDIAVDLTQSAKMTLTALGPNAKVSATKLTVAAVANGIHVDGTSLDGGFANSGDVELGIDGRLVLAAKATGEGSVDVVLFVTTNEVTAHGIEILTDTVSGGIVNEGSIDATGYGLANLSAKAVSDDGPATADARGFVDVEVSGILVEGTSLTGGFQNRGHINLLAEADATAVAFASNAGGNVARAFADAIDADIDVFGLTAEIVTATGDFGNVGDIRAQGLYAVNAKATALGDSGAEAGAAVGGQVSADGIEFDIDDLVGSFSNQGAVTVGASVVARASAYASASAGKAEAGARFRDEMGGTVTGVDMIADSISGSIANSGDVAVRAIAAADLQAEAKALAGTATARISNNFSNGELEVGVLGVSLDASTGEGLANHGQVTASATVILHGTASAVGKTANAAADFPFFPVGAGAQGVDFGAGSLAGSITSTGELRVFSTMDIAVKAEARAGAGPADAGLRMVGINVFGGAVEVDAATIDGRVETNGSALVIAGAFVNLAATATGEGIATATITFEAVTANAIGLDIGVDFVDSVTNSGSFEVLLGVTVDMRVSAVGSRAKATIPNAHFLDLEATGMLVEGSSYSDGILNSGELTAAAILSARATFGMDAYAKGSKAATATGAWRSLTAEGKGLFINVATIGGDVVNQGEVQGGGVIGARAFATAIMGDGGTAHAKAIVSTGTARGTGFTVAAETVFGSIINSGGFVLGEAVAFLALKADASASVQGNASATVSVNNVSVLANGIDIDVGTLGGDAVNNGQVFAAARISATLTASAAGEGGNAKALFAVPSLFANAYDVNGQTIDGDVRNSGALFAEISMNLAVKATMSGTGKAEAQVNAHAFRAEGMEVEFFRILGSVTNSADITARAVFGLSAAAKATGTANANIATQAAQAFGLRVDAGRIDGDFSNSGRVLAFASANGKATGDGGVSARIKATAVAMSVGSNDMYGNVVNDGTLLASAFAVASAFANGGSGTAKAAARATGLDSSDLGNFFGSVENNGLIQVQASAAATATADFGQLHEAVATAIGVKAAATIQAAGGLINAGTILASAKADAPALAIGQVIVDTGLWHGAFSNAAEARISVFASDASKATAIGMAIRGGAVVEGGVVNAGSIFAEAVSGDAKAVAIDLSQATNAAHVVQMLDGALVAVTRITALSLTSAGTAVLMEGNGQADELDWSGGLIEAHIVGTQGQDSMDVFAGIDDKLNFQFNINGLASLDVNTAAHAATPVELRLGGNVSNVTALNVNENGTLVMGVIADATVETYTQDTGATVFFEIGGPSQNGLITVTSKANLAGAIGVRARSGLYFDNQTYTVIAGNLSGTFDTILPINSPLLELASVEDNSPDVTIVVERNPFDSVPGLTHNQKEVAGAIEDFYDPDALFGTEIGEIVGQLFELPTGELLDAYDDLAGAEHAQMAYAGFESMAFMLGGVNQRLHDARSRSSGAGQSASLGAQSLQYAAIDADEGIQGGIRGTQMAAVGNDPDQPGSVWGKGYGSWGSLDGDDEAPGYDRATGAIVVGADYRFDSEFLVGIAGAYSFSNLDFEDGDNGDVDSWQIGLFGSWDSGTWYVDGLVSYAFQGYETERHIDFLDEKAKADYDGGAVQVYGEVGYQFEVGQQALVTPLLGLGYTSVWTDSFTEKGAGAANLKVDEASFDSLATTLGVRGSLNLGGFEPSLFLGWRHEFLDDHGEADMAFAAVPDSKWQVIGSDIGRDSGLVGVGVVAEISAQFEAVVDYGGQFSGSGTSHTGSVGLRIKF